MTKFEALVARCKASVTLTARDHTSNYEALDDYISAARSERFVITDDVARHAIEAGVLYEVQFYPETPRGFYRVYGATAEEAIDAALALLDERGLT